MTQDETIELARQAGFRVGPSRDGPDDVWGVGANLERFAKLVEAKEREQILFAIKEVRGRSQEPVAWMVWGDDNVPSLTFKKPSDKYVFDSLYTTPPQREWVGLTDEEAIQMYLDCNSVSEFFCAIDAKLKYKNTKEQE
jgi:hypothetical protein